MVVNGLPMKRMKRRVTADLFDFFTFPSSSTSVSGSGVTTPFRANIKTFLSKHALMPPMSLLLPHVMTWQIVFRVGDETDSSDPSSSVVYLDVVEEDVARSRSIYCDQCRVVGWSGHPVCSKRYHFIIKADGNSIGGDHKPCVRCGDIVHLSELRCKSCGHVTTAYDVEEWVYNQLEDTTHLLHGVIHSNGYGHLLRVNGREEGGSRVLSGCHIMDFWDRLCKTLAVRKVSVMDVSKKYGLEYRLLHAITKGRSWYGNWGYEFGAGSFALTVDEYKSAVETLSSLPLSIFMLQGLKPSTRLQDTISFYQSLSKSKLVNVKDLFCFLMRLIHDARKYTCEAGDATVKRQRTSWVLPWSRADVARVEEAMFKVLRAVSGSHWVSSRALRGAVCRVAPPALLDNCLMELRGKVAAEGMVVNARSNPVSGLLEYRLEPQNVSISTGGNDACVPNCPPSEEILKQDLQFLYESILHPQTMSICPPDEIIRNLAISSAEKLLDCKQFVKHYKNEMLSSGNGTVICISCELELREKNKEIAPDPPAELVVLPVKATISDLKTEASKAFQEVYLAFRRFQAEELRGFGGVEDSTQVKLLIGSTGSVRLRGRCPGKIGTSKYRLERGMERWTVDCKCGAKDDDGERMLACDVCGVWQHTRCSGINDSEAVPAKFVCNRCIKELAPTRPTVKQCKSENGRSGNSGTAPCDVR